MKIIDELIDDLSSDRKKLSDILIRTKVLAHKLKNKNLIAWINKEINGYQDNDSLPIYRQLTAVVSGTISNGYQRANNYPIPLMHLDHELRDTFLKMKLNNGIATLEDFVNSKNTLMMRHIPPEFYAKLSQNYDSDFVVEYAKSEINKAQVSETLTSIKSKLLDFLLELNDEIEVETDIEQSTKEINESIDNLFNNSVFGNNTTIIVGDNNKQKVDIKSVKGDFSALENLLKENKLPESDIQELKVIIDDDNPDHANSRFGDKVKIWINKMMMKAMESSWKISIGAAGSLLAEGIKAYYGW